MTATPSPEWTEQREARVRARIEAATPGPWTWEDWDGAPPCDDLCECWSLVAPPDARTNGPSAMYPDLGKRILDDESRECSEADKVFIANARTDLADALSELARLRAENERLTTLNENQRHNVEFLMAENVALRAATREGRDVAVRILNSAHE